MNASYSVNPLFSLLRLIESLGGTNIFEICLNDGRRVAEIGVQNGRICWVSAPVREVRLGETIGRLQEIYAQPEWIEKFSEIAAAARAEDKPFGEALLERKEVPYEIVRAALRRQIVRNIQALLKACGTEALSCRRQELPVSYSDRLTFNFVEVVLAVASAGDRLPRDASHKIFMQYQDRAEAALLLVRSKDLRRLPLLLKSRGLGLVSLDQVIQVCKTVQTSFESPEFNPGREPLVSLVQTGLDGVWVGVNSERRTAILRFADAKTAEQALAELPAPQVEAS